MIKWVQFLQCPPPKICDGKKIAHNFFISGKDQHIKNRKSSSSSTTPPTLGEKNLAYFGPQTKLDGQGRARREAARRRKSEWKVNVAIPNSSRSNGSWQITPKTVSLSIVEPRGIWTCVSLQCTSTAGGSICAL